MFIRALLAEAGGSLWAMATPVNLALAAVPLCFLALVIGLERRHVRLAQRLESERIKADRLHYAAYHDNLTELRNRHALNADVDEILAGSDAGAKRLALLLFDLDRFKFINDTLGHAVGDAVLRSLAQRLQRHASARRRVYRLGGDEFVVLWDGVRDDAEISAFCAMLSETVFQPVLHGTGSISTAGSIGIATAYAPEAQLADLLKQADLALYRAKSLPGISHCFFSEDMDVEYRMRRELEVAMRDGIARDAFGIEYLPVIRTDTLTPSGFKARLNWHRSGHGDVAHDVFMPMAEDSGLIVILGKWMLRRALMDAASWGVDAELTVPVATLQFRDPCFAALVLALLDETGVAPGRLVLEVPSTAGVGDCAASLENIASLRAGGVLVAVSEIAASVAGLSMTRLHEVDRVRIDLVRVRAIAGERRMSQMLKLFLQLAATVGTPVTLTGVDTEEDLQLACEMQPAEVQGGFCGKPLSAAQARCLFTSMDQERAQVTGSGPRALAHFGFLKAC
ncbi:putative bifunctional diguanylate cyclase/phosphodiesterase [Hoeflea olei]|uniref:putative bifunctional diguanylate cyclase/phosphodiesterase n=1 Tax=Hoeflea olei TaxID=1480615 RepID=UPI001FD9DED2|nr:diguanylate cyclase [Hoeflea olei]